MLCKPLQALGLHSHKSSSSRRKVKKSVATKRKSVKAKSATKKTVKKTVSKAKSKPVKKKKR